MTGRLRTLLNPARSTEIPVVTDPAERRGIVAELVIVGILTFAFSALSAVLSLIEAQLSGGIGHSTVALNPSRSELGWIDFMRQLMGAVRLFAIGSLGAYLLWRSGIPLRRVGLGRWVPRHDMPRGLGLAALIGLPGLALVAAAHALGLNAHLVPSDVHVWWRWPMLVLVAVGNAAAEEIVVVAYFITRLRQLGAAENGSLLASAVLRGGYHLYQGIGAGFGNIVMGVVFGRYYQLSTRTWPLVIAHATIDIVAFVGYALLRDHLGWVG